MKEPKEEELKKEIDRLRKKLAYAYNKAYILANSPMLSSVKTDAWKLLDAVKEFKDYGK